MYSMVGNYTGVLKATSAQLGMGGGDGKGPCGARHLEPPLARGDGHPMFNESRRPGDPDPKPVILVRTSRQRAGVVNAW